MQYFSIFFKKFNEPCINFSLVWTTNTICWKFSLNFRKFSKVFLSKLRKCIILPSFSKNLTIHALIFRKRKLLGNFEKILKDFDENSMGKLNFYLFLESFITKNRAVGNNTILPRI